MLLILTNSQDATADYLASVLERRGVEFLRFDTDTSLSAVELSYDGEVPLLRSANRWHRPDDFGNVWYRRPEKLKDARFHSSPEGEFVLDEWSEALEGFFAHIPRPKWMNHPSANVLASHKIDQLSRAKALGLRIPDTLITHDESRLREFFARHHEMVIAKPMARGYVERPQDQMDSLIYTNLVLQADLEILDDLRACPTLFQEYIDKRCDVRITVVDSHLIATQLVATDHDGGQRCDIRRNNMEDVTYAGTTLPEQVASKINALMDHYDLRFAAIDMVVDKDGQWYFLEVNPNGQWAWLDLTGGMDIASCFVKAFAEC